MKHRALIVGAGRIGAGYNWHDDAYTHAGAYNACKDRVKLVGFVEPDLQRRVAAEQKWGRPAFGNLKDALAQLHPDVVSICTQPGGQEEAILECVKMGVKAFYCEKPYHGPMDLIGIPIQVNYLRRGCKTHQMMKAHLEEEKPESTLFAIAKDDFHTRCHFEDLCKWWGCGLEYFPFNGPNSYLLRRDYGEKGTFETLFSLGGINGGECMKAMLGNLLDHVVNNEPLWSPAR